MKITTGTSSLTIEVPSDASAVTIPRLSTDVIETLLEAEVQYRESIIDDPQGEDLAWVRQRILDCRAALVWLRGQRP